MNGVDVVDVRKSYGKVTALDGVSFRAEPGELFGLIGPDGAGKTSMFRILSTVLLADGGSATVAGLDVVRDMKVLRSNLGYMPGKFSLYQDLTVRENLEFFATLFGTTIEANRHLVHDIYVQLEPFNSRRAGALSGGMKQKLALCCALIHEPEVLLLDEPTTGVDPVSRKEFWSMLRRLTSSGITILVSTPYMDEAVLCDRIALINHGRLLGVNTPAEIVAAFPVPLFSASEGDLGTIGAVLRSSPYVESVHRFGDEWHVTLYDLSEQTRDSLPPLTSIQPSVEDCFIRLMST